MKKYHRTSILSVYPSVTVWSKLNDLDSLVEDDSFHLNQLFAATELVHGDTPTGDDLIAQETLANENMLEGTHVLDTTSLVEQSVLVIGSLEDSDSGISDQIGSQSDQDNHHFNSSSTNQVEELYINCRRRKESVSMVTNSRQPPKPFSNYKLI